MYNLSVCFERKDYHGYKEKQKKEKEESETAAPFDDHSRSCGSAHDSCRP